MIKPLDPGATIGILGGGQLGRMLSCAASRLGFKTHIFEPSKNCPAAHVANAHTVADYDDTEALVRFARACDVVTYEFENVPVLAAKTVKTEAPVRPGVRCLEVAQDRLVEKTFIQDAGIDVAGFHPIKNEFDLKRRLKSLDLPMVLKTRRMGYDGKGQVILRDNVDPANAFKAINQQPAIIEDFIPFKREVSIIAARNQSGNAVAYPLIENEHRDHILYRSVAPAKGDTGKAEEIAFKLLDALDYIGVLAVEFFELEDGTLLVNEIAPRVHNSGHWTQNAGCVDQFELHIRAIAGWPLGDVRPKNRIEMRNLLGKEIEAWKALAAEPGLFLHFYGKSEPRKGRKMGHVNRILD